MTIDEAIMVLENGKWWDGCMKKTLSRSKSEHDALEQLCSAINLAVGILQEQQEKNEPHEWFNSCPVCGKPVRITPAKEDK